MTTQTVTKFACDRCGREDEGYRRDERAIELPFRWIHVQREHGGGSTDSDVMDLCPDCAASFEEWRGAVVPTTVGGNDG